MTWRPTSAGGCSEQPPATLEHIFGAFYTTKPNSMGMGLSISHSIIKAHGGRLWAEANVPHGAIFQFTLVPVVN